MNHQARPHLRWIGVISCVLALAACGNNDNTNQPTPDMPAVDGVDMSDMPSDMVRDTTNDLSDLLDMQDMEPLPLVANAGENVTGLVGQTLTLDASASTGATTYQWDFGDGQRWETPRDTPVAMVTYNMPGRYKVVLTAFDAKGKKRTDALVVTVTKMPTHKANTSSSMSIKEGAPTQLGALSEDGATLSIIEGFDTGQFTLTARKTVCPNPKHIASWTNGWAITCPRAPKVELHIDGQAQPTAIALPHGSRPHGVVFHNDKLYVTLQGPGKVAVIDPNAGTILDTVDAIEDARGISVLPNERLLITRWRSPDEVGKLVILDLNAALARQTWTLPFDPRNASDTEHGGVPNYLESAVVDPTGELVVVPSLQANIKHGLVFNQKPFAHDISVRATLSFIDPNDGVSTYDTRYQFDSRGLASAAVFNPNGADLYVSMRGSRLVERLDMLSRGESGTIFDVGYAPQALLMSPDGRYLFVDASLSRHVGIYDVKQAAQPTPVGTISLVDQEPLTPGVLLGKQLFNDSFDLKITQEGYIACAHCHLDGESDLLTWDFTDRGEGLRNTTSLLGRMGAGHGPIHWSGNFDEIQDFEHDIREHFKGQGFLDDTMYQMSTPLGAPKAGQSVELDALAAYVTSLDWYHQSPYRTATGELSNAAKRGKLIFESAEAQCTTCHSGAALTDSAFITQGQPRLHDVGTLKMTSGKRLNGPLTGIDTPTLHGIFNSPNYLHDGSASTIKDVLTTANPNDTHGKTSQLTPAQIDDLVAYLQSLEG